MNSRTSFNYRSESERPSVQQIIAEGSRIDRLYLGKFIPLREKKLLDKLLRTRAVYDDAVTDYLSDSNDFEKKPGKPCTCDFTDCESLFDLLKEGRFRKIKQSVSRITRKIEKKTRQSARKKNKKQKHRKGVITSLSSLSNLSVQTEYADKRKRTSQTHKHKSKKQKTKGVSFHSRSRSRSAPAGAVNKIEERKSKQTYFGSKQKPLRHVQTESHALKRCFCTLKLKGKKTSVSTASLSDYATHKVGTVDKKRHLKNTEVNTKHKQHLKYTQAGEALSRCLCTLKLKSKPKKMRTRGSMTTVGSSQFHRGANTNEKRELADKFTGLQPFECEPNICVPDECNPKECLQLKHKQNLRQDIFSNESMPDFYKIIEEKTVKVSQKQDKKKQNKRLKLKPSMSKESFTAVSDFNKLRKEKPVAKQQTQADSKYKQHMQRKQNVSKESLTSYHEIYKTRKEKTTESKQILARQKIQTQTKHAQHLKQTQAGRVRKEQKPKKVIHTKESMTFLEIMRPLESRNQESATDIHTKTKAQGKLLPFECEPHICIPEKCKPQDCLKIIKTRQGAHLERDPKTFRTEPRKTRSTSSLTAKHVIPAKAKRVQSTSSRKPRLKTRDDELIIRKMSREIKTSQSTPVRKFVKSSANSSMNVRVPTKSIPQTAIVIKRQKMNYGKRPNKRWSQGDIRHQISVTTEAQKKNIGFGSALKRCFCTLKLHKSKKNNKRTDYNLSKGTVTPPKNKINVSKGTKYSSKGFVVDKHTKTKQQKYKEQKFTHEASTSSERIKMKSVSSTTKVSGTSYAKKHKIYQPEIKSSNIKQVNMKPDCCADLCDTCPCDEFLEPCEEICDPSVRPTLRIASSLSFSIVFSKTQCPDFQNDLREQEPDEADRMLNDNRSRRIYNKTIKVKPRLKRCFCSLQLQEALDRQQDGEKVYTVSRMTTSGTNWNTQSYKTFINSKIQKQTDSIHSIAHCFERNESRLEIGNNEESSYYLLPSSSFISSPSTNVSRVDSDYNYNLNYFDFSDKQINDFVSNTCKCGNVSPFSRTYYAMNVHKTQKTNASKTKKKLDPNECEPGICIPYKCNPYECKKWIDKRLLANKLSETTKTSKKSKGVSYQKLPKKRKEVSVTTINIKKKTDSAIQKPVKQSKSTSVAKLKRCFCTLQFQKKPKPPPPPPKEKPAKPPKPLPPPPPPPPPAKEKKEETSQTEVHECEPHICIPEKCDPYECLLERSSGKRKIQYRRISACSCKTNKGKGAKSRQLIYPQQPRSDNHLKTSCSITRSSYPNKQAVKIASTLSFSIEFIKEVKPSKPKKPVEKKKPIPPKKPVPPKKPIPKKKSAASAISTKTVKKVQVVQVKTKPKKVVSHASTNVKKKKEKTQKIQVKKPEKVVAVLKRCFCTLTLQKVQKVEEVTVVKSKGVSSQKEKKKPDLKTTSTEVKLPPTSRAKSVPAKKQEPDLKTTAVTARILEPHECEPGVCVPRKCDPKKCYQRMHGSPPPSEPKKEKPVKKAKSAKSLPSQKPKKDKKKQEKPKPIVLKTVTTQTPKKVKKKSDVYIQPPKSPPAIKYRKAVEIGSNFSFCVKLAKERNKEIPLKRCYCAKSLNKVVKVYRMSNHTGWIQNYSNEYFSNLEPVAKYMKSAELKQDYYWDLNKVQTCVSTTSRDSYSENMQIQYKSGIMEMSSHKLMHQNNQLPFFDIKV